MEKSENIIDPNYVPQEFTTPYDIVELPSQGLLYKNKKSKVKIEYLTALDESILTSPNLSSDPTLMLDVLLKRKVKDLGFEVEELLDGDRIALLMFLRTTGLGEKYKQYVWDEKSVDLVEGEIDLSKLELKKLVISPDENGEFDYMLPHSKTPIKFRFLTGRDEREIDSMDKLIIKRDEEKISSKVVLRLERSVTEYDGNRDKIYISNALKKITLIDSRKLRKYITDNEPGLDFNTTATILGGGSVSAFFRFGTNFLWPEL
tara:strand:+ start:493 stop:1275 length:783 start_codon:yes stop_codon:yes gene_type:complete